MGAIVLRVKCGKCANLLLEFERGAKGAEIKVQRFGTTVVRTGVAKCDKCGTENPFDTKHLMPRGSRGT